MIPVVDRDLETLLLYAVRYAMGRCSAAPSQVAGMVRTYRDGLSPHREQQISAEITEELRRCEEAGTTLGDACDHATWTQLVRDLGD